MAVFGAPVAHGHDPERAVPAALGMQECAALNAESFHGLTLRVGVNTGEVMFAPVGPRSRREFTVIGDAVNTGGFSPPRPLPGFWWAWRRTARRRGRSSTRRELPH
jgi:hypothetical protein